MPKMQHKTVSLPEDVIKALNVWRANKCLKFNKMPTFTDAVVYHLKKALKG